MESSKLQNIKKCLLLSVRLSALIGNILKRRRCSNCENNNSPLGVQLNRTRPLQFNVTKELFANIFYIETCYQHNHPKLIIFPIHIESTRIKCAQTIRRK